MDKGWTDLNLFAVIKDKMPKDFPKKASEKKILLGNPHSRIDGQDCDIDDLVQLWESRYIILNVGGWVEFYVRTGY